MTSVKTMTSQEDLKVSVARIDERTRNISSRVDEIFSQISSNYVLKEEFYPVKNVVFGLVGLLLTCLMVAIVAMVIK